MNPLFHYRTFETSQTVTPSDIKAAEKRLVWEKRCSPETKTPIFALKEETAVMPHSPINPPGRLEFASPTRAILKEYAQCPPGTHNRYDERYLAKGGRRKTKSSTVLGLINYSGLRKLRIHINGTIKAAAYFDLLGANVLPIMDDSALLQQDNAPSYCAQATHHFL